MKKIIIALVLLLLSAAAFAHPYFSSLEQGQLRGAYWFNPFGGYEGESIPLIEDNAVIGYIPAVLLPNYQTGFTGDYLYAEYGIFDWLSVGMKISPLSFLVHGMEGHGWVFPACTSVRAVFLSGGFNGFLDGAVDVEFSMNPLFADDTYYFWGSGLNNLYVGLAFGGRIIEEEEISLTGCLDFKYLTSFINPNYEQYYFGSLIDNLENGFAGYHRLALAPGLEFRWGSFTAYIGFHFKILDFLVSEENSYLVNYLFNEGMFWSSQDVFGLQVEYTLTF